MSRADFRSLRESLNTWVAEHGPGAYRALADRMGGRTSDEAIRLFAEGHTKAPRFAEALEEALGGRTRTPDLHEEASRALRLIREGQEALSRVVQRIAEGEHGQPVTYPTERDQVLRAVAEVAQAQQRAAAEQAAPRPKKKRA